MGKAWKQRVSQHPQRSTAARLASVDHIEYILAGTLAEHPELPPMQVPPGWRSSPTPKGSVACGVPFETAAVVGGDIVRNGRRLRVAVALDVLFFAPPEFLYEVAKHVMRVPILHAHWHSKQGHQVIFEHDLGEARPEDKKVADIDAIVCGIHRPRSVSTSDDDRRWLQVYGPVPAGWKRRRFSFEAVSFTKGPFNAVVTEEESEKPGPERLREISLSHSEGRPVGRFEVAEILQTFCGPKTTYTQSDEVARFSGKGSAIPIYRCTVDPEAWERLPKIYDESGMPVIGRGHLAGFTMQPFSNTTGQA